MKLHFALTSTIGALASFLFLGGQAAAEPNLCEVRANTVETAPQPVRIPGSTPYIYKSIDGADLRVHVFSPVPGNVLRPSPAIVFYFGGAWMIGTVAEFVPQAEYFAARGATVVLVEYRTFCRNHVSIVDEMSDAKAAIRWVRRHTAQLGVDPDRIAASGASSGGQMAASAAMPDTLNLADEVSAKPNLLVFFYPCVDETTEEEKSYGGDAIGVHGHEASPLYNITSDLPPMIIFQGTADSLYAENKTYCSAVIAKGNHCEFVEYQGAPHGFFNARASGAKWYLALLSGMDQFLSRAGYLAPLAATEIPGRPVIP